MKIFVSCNKTKILEVVLKEKLDVLNLDYTIVGSNEIRFNDPLNAKSLKKLTVLLEPYGIRLIDHQNHDLVDRIKSALNEMIFNDDAQIFNTSDYLSDKLHYSYSYLSTLFSETTHTSIENYIILAKIDKAKDLLINSDLNLTEIAFKINYSSVSHLSRQFKKTTGLTPSLFQKIIKKRKQLN